MQKAPTFLSYTLRLRRTIKLGKISISEEIHLSTEPQFLAICPFSARGYVLYYKRSAQIERENLEQNLRLIFSSALYEWEFLKAKLVEASSKDKFAAENLTLRRSEYELELSFDLGYAIAEKSETEKQLMEARYRLLLFLARLLTLAGKEPFILLEYATKPPAEKKY